MSISLNRSHLPSGGLAIGIFDKGIVNHAAGAGFVTAYLIQWFLWVMFFSPGEWHGIMNRRAG